MHRRLVGRLALLVAVLMGASLLPVITPQADARLGLDAAASVDVYRQWAVTGNKGANGGEGEVRLYRFDESTGFWSQEIAIANPNPGSITSFGHSVAVGPFTTSDVALIVIGSPDDDLVLTYTWDPATGTLVNGDGVFSPDANPTNFGASVDTDHNLVLVGAPGTSPDDDGRAYIFENAQFSASVATTLLPTNAAADGTPSLFGSVVQFDGLAANPESWVGAPGENSVYGFNQTGGATPTQIVTEAVDQFGSMLSSDRGRVLIGAPGQTQAWLQSGVNQTIVTSPSGSVIADVALEGNLIAFDTTVGAATGDVEILSDDGSTGSFAFKETFSQPVFGAQEIVLGGGYLLMAGFGEFLDPNQVFISYGIDDGLTEKIVPSIGWQESNFGGSIDVDGPTMVAVRGESGSLAQVVVSTFDGADWVTSQLIDLPGPIGGGVAIQDNVFAASVGDSGTGNFQVVVYERPDALSPFTLQAGFSTPTGAPPRAVAIDDAGQQLALGFPGAGQVELYTGAPGTWGETPQIIVPNDAQGTGSNTFGWDLDFGENSLLIGKPGATSFNSPAAFPGVAEQWSIGGDGTAVYFGDLVPSTSAPGDFAGWTVEIEEGLKAVGSPGVGSVQVYRTGLSDSFFFDPSPVTGNNWAYAMDLDAGVLVVSDWLGDTVAVDLYAEAIPTYLATYQSPDLEQSDFAFQTFPLATSDGVVMTGARLEDSQGRDAGAVYTFSVTPSEPPTPPRAWPSVVDIDADYAVVGNPAEGLVHVLFNGGAGWTETQQISGAAADSFGAGVALEGDRLYIGSPDADGGLGRLAVWARSSDGLFSEVGSTGYSAATPVDEFGAIIDASGEWVIAGAPFSPNISSAVLFDRDLTVEAAVFNNVDSLAGFGSSVALGRSGLRDAQYDLAWVGAPTANDNTGLVFGWSFDGTTWLPAGSSPGATIGDRYGSALEGSGTQVGVSQPGSTASVLAQGWGADAPTAARGPWATPSVIDGDIAHNAAMLAAGSVTAGEVYLLQDDGTSRSLLGTVSGVAGDSLALDGDWLIATTGATGTDWTALVTVVDVTTVGTSLHEAPNKLTPEFGTDYNRYGSLLDSTADTWVIGAPSFAEMGAPNSFEVYDQIDGSLIQRVIEPTVNDPWLDLAVDGNRLAILDTNGVTLLDRAGPGLPYDTESAAIPLQGGDSIDVQGDLLAVGDRDLNRVFVYSADAGGAWAPVAGSPFTPATVGADDLVGYSVAVSGDVVAAGAPKRRATDEAGYVAVWARGADGTWSEQPSLDAAGTYFDTYGRTLDRFGRSIDFDGSWLVVGAPEELEPAVQNSSSIGNPGLVYVFPHAGDGTFGTLTIIDPALDIVDNGTQAAWGHSVAVSDDTVAIGGPGYQTSGATAYMGTVVAYTHDAVNGTWSLASFDEGAGVDQILPGNRDFLGDTVAISSVTVVSGAPEEDTASREAGAAYTFTVSPVVTPEPENKLVSEVGADLTDDEVGDLFGYSIDSDGARLVIGAPEAASIPAPVGDVGSGGTGGVFVYTRNADDTGWDFEQYVENPAPTDFESIASAFGESVAIDGDLLVVGAPDTGGQSTGTAWVIDLTGATAPVEILPAEVTGSARYGESVDIEGSTIVVGASAMDFAPDGTVIANAGRFWVWENDPATGWQVVFTEGGGVESVQYGFEVDIDGGNIAVSTIGNVGLGFVDVWRPDAAEVYVADPRLEGPAAGAQYGFGLDLDGDRLVVGAPNWTAAFLYTYDGVAWTETAVLTPEPGTIGGKFGFSVASDGTVIAVGEIGDDTELENQGRIHVFGNTGFNEWTLIDEFVAPDPGEQDWLGFDLEVNGGKILATAPFDDNTNGLDAGAVYTFSVTPPPPPEPPVSGKLVSEPGSDVTDAEVADWFGYAMDTDGARLVVGAPETSLPGTGGVYVFTRNADNTGWDFEQYIENPDPNAQGSQFGAAVAIDGDRLVVGAPDAGATGEGTAWIIDLGGVAPPVEIAAPDAAAFGSGSFYGTSVDVDGSIVAVGAPGYDYTTPSNDNETDVGKVYIWEELAGAWSTSFQIGSGIEFDLVGTSVSLDGDALAIGSPAEIGGGYVTVHRRIAADQWVGDPSVGSINSLDEFGYSVDLDGDRLIVGSPGADHAQIFTWDGTIWTEEALLVDPTLVTGTSFGHSVSLDGTVAVVGEIADGAGVAHVFGNTAWQEWTPLTSYEAADGVDGDDLGWSVTVSGGSVIAGAPYDDNSNGADAGAAYEFSVTPPPPPQPPVDPTIIESIEYVLPSSVMPGATSVTVEGTSVATTSSGATAGGGIVAASVGSIDLDSPPTGTTATENPLGDITLAELGIDADGAGLDALMQVPLSEFPIEGGWAAKLAGTEFEGVPLQAITLGQVWNLSSVQSIPLKFTEIEASPLKFTDIAVIGFGSLDLLDIDLDGDPATSSLTEWCDVLESQATSCADLGIEAGSNITLGTVSAAGVNIEATPLKFTPLKFTYIEASPLKFTPLKFTDIQASPLKFTPLKFTPLKFTPLKFTPLKFTPLKFTPLKFTPLKFTPLKFTDITATPLKFTPLKFTTNPGNIADCTIVDCTDETVTIEDAFLAGALLDGFTLDDIGDAALGDLRFEDILPGLSEESVAALLAELDSSGATLEDLFDQFGIDGIGDLTLGDIDPEAFEIIAELSEYTIGEFLASLPEDVLAGFTLSDFLLLFIPREAYNWDDVDLGSINLQLAGMQAPLTASVAFTTADGPETDDVTLLIDLPAGGVAQESTFRLAPTGASIENVTVTDTAATVEIADVPRGVEQLLTFGIYQGLDLGTSDSLVIATATTSGGSGSAGDSITVVEAFEPDNDGLAGAVPVLADNLYVSHLGTGGDADFFRLTVTEPATTVSVQLANLAADFDLVVYGPQLGSILPPDDTEAASAPTADFDASGSGSTLSPVPLNDLPTSLDELEVYGASYFRGTDAEQVDFLAIDAGDYFVQVTGYLGASSPKPYSLRAATTPTVELECGAPPASFTPGAPGTNTSAGGADTLVLMNRSRFQALYGPDATAEVLTALDAMIAAAAGNGINATVLDVDGFAGVQAAYDAWDATPCSAIAVNNVVGAISAELLSIRGGQPIDNLLIVGGDDVVPFARVKDATTIANEQSYTNTFTAAENNALRTAFSESWLLTDDPYGDRAPTPIANTDRFVYVPELAMGRLVETPTEIVSALTHYVTFNGRLDPQTGFVAGYDFLDDGAEQTGDNLDEVISPATVQRLINSTWTSADLQAGLSTNPDTALVAAHFDHANALPAASDSAGTTADLFDVFEADTMDFTGSIMFSVGCHGGLSVSDLLIAPTGVVSKDWAQTFLGNGAAAFVGNTGYGYGDDTAVALSEKLMADFAAGLGDYETIGEALLYAKQNYAADLTVYGAFDEKALMEATLYGIPFYTLGNTIVPEPVPNPPTEPAPTGGQAYTDSYDPVIEVTGNGTEDEVWSTPGDDGEPQVQVTNGYPILPRYEFEVTQQDPSDPLQLELEARGVVLESLVTRDEIDVDPATARAVYDLAANEPNLDSPDVTFSLAPAINTYLTPEGVRQDVNMTVGAFQSSSTDGSGTMRLFEAFEATVYYADNPAAESTKPTITGVQANPAGGAFNLAVTAQDASPIVRVLALVTPTPVPNQATTWQLLELADAGGGTWTGDIALPGESIQWLVMAVDTHGNTAWSMSKQLAFDGNTDAGFAPVLTNPVAPATPVLIGDTVELSAEVWDFDGSDDAISVTWDFGDGTTCTTGSGGSCLLDAPTDADPFGSSTASHSYTDPGAYPVTVTATDATGKTATLTMGPVVVTSETTQGSVVANGRTRAGIGDDDILPDGVGRRTPIKINVTAGYTDNVADQFEVRFTIDGVFDLRGDSFDYVDVVGDTALVVGTGTLTLDSTDEMNVVYTVLVDDSTNRVTVSVWPEGSDPDTTTPLYRITSELTKRTAIKITS